MRVTFGGRTMVMLGSIPSTALDFPALEAAAGLTTRPASQVTQQGLALAQYAQFRVLITPDGRLQFESQPNLARDTARRLAIELVRQATPYPVTAVGFNGVGRVEIDEDESDPAALLLRRDAIEARLDTGVLRAGVSIQYSVDDDALRLDLQADPDDERAWAFSINRNYPGPLADIPDAAIQRGMSWFSALPDELPRTARRLLAASEDQENAA